jgi:DNA helicase-2/ATP-dependent DNA helicase PcrA
MQHNIDIVSNKIRYEDLDYYLYFKDKIENFEENENIKLIVIDEIQDYTTTQINILKKIYSKANFIFVGDSRQSILKKLNYDEIFKLFKDIEFYELNKSFRSTSNINKFTNNLIGILTESIDREGEEIEKIKTNYEDLNKDVIKHMLKNRRKLSAIITKTNEELENLKKYLIKEFKDVQINYLNEENEIQNGINVIPLYLSKGLEFDYVIVYNIDSYNLEFERNLLYTACTRALHKLDLFYIDQII